MEPEELNSAVTCMSLWILENYSKSTGIKSEQIDLFEPPEVPAQEHDTLVKNATFFNSDILKVVDIGKLREERHSKASENLTLTLPLPVPTRANLKPTTGEATVHRRPRMRLNKDEYQLEIPNLNVKELYEVLDENNVFTKRRERENLNFISDDPQENADINDQEWDKVKNLRTDQDRKLFAVRAFGNAHPADPTKNMSYFGFLRKKLGLGAQDAPSRDIKKNVGIINGRLEWRQRDKDIIPGRKRKASGEHDQAPAAKKAKMVDVSEFTETLEKIVIGHRQKIMKPKDLKYFVRHWRRNSQETASFYKYYDDNDLVEAGELNKNDNTEFLFVRFSTFYGIQEPTECKDCSFEDGKKVVHFM